MPEQPTRRKVLLGAAGAAAGSLAGLGALQGWRVLSQPRTRVTTLRAPDYDESRLVDLLFRGLTEYPQVLARVRGGRVVLKPNMVEFLPDHPINTDPRLLAAAVEAFRKHGASQVVVAEGPGHHRDMEYLREATGLDEQLSLVGASFVDLNVDRVTRVTLPRDLTGLGNMQLPVTALDTDLLVSVAKLKTHHWVGATLTMKNLFGCVPGVVYGWPKNVLHWAGIDRSIVDLWLALRPGFGIIDGVVAMEGDGPIMGTPRPTGVIFMGPQLPAVDAVATRFMDMIPARFSHLAAAARLGGTIAPSRIELLGDPAPAQRFAILDKFATLRGG